jgi:hypothetical protein
MGLNSIIKEKELLKTGVYEFSENERIKLLKIIDQFLGKVPPTDEHLRKKNKLIEKYRLSNDNYIKDEEFKDLYLKIINPTPNEFIKDFIDIVYPEDNDVISIENYKKRNKNKKILKQKLMNIFINGFELKSYKYYIQETFDKYLIANFNDKSKLKIEDLIVNDKNEPINILYLNRYLYEEYLKCYIDLN